MPIEPVGFETSEVDVEYVKHRQRQDNKHDRNGYVEPHGRIERAELGTSQHYDETENSVR